MTALPAGFVAHTANIGIKDDSLDFVVVLGASGTTGTSMLTKSRFAGASVLLSRELGAAGRTRGVVVVSKNSNVATGEQGMRNARELVSAVAARIGCNDSELVVASTGVIGRQYPMDRVRSGIAALPTQLTGTDASLVARAIMTTDTRPRSPKRPCAARRRESLALPRASA